MGLSLLLVAAIGIVLYGTFRQSTAKVVNSFTDRTLLLLMVKNEHVILPRLLESAKKTGIKYLFLCDTGSNDNTTAVARSVWPSEGLFIQNNVTFVNFETTRNECNRLMVEQTGHLIKLEWILLADADFSIHQRHTLEPTFDVNMIQIHGQPHNSLNMLIRRAVFVKNCRYRLYTHEYLDCNTGKNHTFGHHDGLFFSDHSDGSSRPDKLNRDIRLLVEWLKYVNETDLRPRALYYLARAHEDRGDMKDALRIYELHNKEQTFSNYRFYALYRIALIHMHLNHSSSIVEHCLLSAFSEYDGYFRREVLYQLARYNRLVVNNLHTCILYATAGMNLPAIDHSRMPLFLENYIYAWALQEELAFCLVQRGLKREARYHYEQIIKVEGLDTGARERVEQQLKLL